MSRACLMWCGLTLILGIVLGSSCHEPEPITIFKADTSTKVHIVERPVFISDTIKVKSVQLKYKDYFNTDTVNIPCNDTSFIAQADSVITSTNDTINMAFNYANRKGFFSLVYKPRPDSIKVETIEIPIEKQSNYGFIIGTFGVGLFLGLLAGVSK